MQIFNDLLSKIFFTLIILALLVGGYIFLVRTLVKPPQITNNNQPLPATTPTPTSNPTIVQSSSIPDNGADLSGDILPAIAQPDGIVIEAPKRLEPGGILKVYVNTNNAEYPDPLNYSPSKIIETNGLEMVNLKQESNKFQQAEGYFLAPGTGEYSFVVELPEDYRDVELAALRVQIDGIVLSSPLGGQIYLESGYHKIALLNNYSVQGDYPSITWAAQGDEVKPLKVFREVEQSTN